MNQKIVTYFFIAIAISTAGSIKALAQQHQHREQHNDLRSRSGGFASSPYVEQLDSSVRGLSSEEVDNLLKGKGAGYARMAELNG